MTILKHAESLAEREVSPQPVAIADAPVSNGRASVSVVIPCYNEERFIGKSLHNLADQYDHDRYQIIIVDGLSEDRTREVIAEFRRSRPDVNVMLIDNPARSIPTALNLGIRKAEGEIIARLDAHAVASPGYIRHSVEVLRQDGIGVVGMPCQVCPGAETLMAKAIAMAVSHPFGIGDAKYRLRKGAAQQEAVDTVAFACFKKELWREIGGFDEKLLTNEDYEFNYRIRLLGKTVLLDRSEHCDYFARTTLKELFLQYSRYGIWKARMILRHPRSIKWRHTIAPLFVASLPILLFAGFWLRPAWWLLLAEIVAYLFLALVFAVDLARKAKGGFRLMLSMPLVFCTIHLTWGGSFLLGLAKPPRSI
ncbi:MAG: glycosyltransferase family 2 protein [Acidobacteriota bacterium]|nr:glycosyltransferase family 2 protein [Acidobacteriota bacterium]